MKRKLSALLIIAALLMTACGPKVNVDPGKAARDIRSNAEIARKAAVAAVEGIDALLRSELVSGNSQIVAALQTARPVALTFKDAVIPLADLAASIVNLTESDRAKLKEQLKEVQAAFRAAGPQLAEVAGLIAPLIDKNANVAEIQGAIKVGVASIDLALSVLSARLE